MGVYPVVSKSDLEHMAGAVGFCKALLTLETAHRREASNRGS